MFSFATLFLLPILVSSQQLCFNRNGIRTHDMPCNPDAAHSACCGPTFKCLSNGLCAPGPDTAAAGYQVITAFYQGACTDSTWQDGACPNFCTSKLDAPSGQGLQACAAAGEGKYCCWRSGQDCCKNGTAILDIGVANAFTTFGRSATSSALTSSTSMVSITTSIAESVTSDAPTSATSGVTSATNQWLSGTPASSQTGVSENSSGPDNTAIGVGVGIPLILGLIAAALLYRRRKRRQAAYAYQAPVTEKPELDSWNPSPSHSTGMADKHYGILQQHELDAENRRVFELR